MGKGKKKANKGKKRNGGKKTRDDQGVICDPSSLQIEQQIERIRLAAEMASETAANRTEDPLKNWTRLRNEECPICMLPLPLEPSEFNYCVTCGKTVCMGCACFVLLKYTKGMVRVHI